MLVYRWSVNSWSDSDIYFKELMKTEKGEIINERRIDWTAVTVLLITALFYGAGWYFLTSYRLEAHETRLKATEEKCEKIEVLITEVGWIKDTMKQVYNLK
jgi:heme/copper-type cytochrome/quinol oxidase subunit 2